MSIKLRLARDIVEQSEEFSQEVYDPEVGDFEVTIFYFDSFTQTDQKKIYSNVDRDRVTSLLKKYAGTLREATIRKLPPAPLGTSA